MTTRVPASSSLVIPLDPLKALSATWRKKYPAQEAHKQSADDYWAGQCSVANRCADELDALLAVSSQRTEEKDDTRVD